jgi:hypothetical protein
MPIFNSKLAAVTGIMPLSEENICKYSADWGENQHGIACCFLFPLHKNGEDEFAFPISGQLPVTTKHQ